MGRSLGLTLSLLLLAGCASTGDGGAQPAPAPRVERKSKLHRFEFKDLEANRETGGELPGGQDVELIDGQGHVRRLSEFRGRPLVLVFTRGFPGYICPYCSTYTAQIATRYDEIAAAGAEVALVFPSKDESEGKRGEFIKAVQDILSEEGDAALPFPIFLDPGLRAVTRFNLLGDLSKPATFVLDANGVVRYAYVGRTPDERPSVDRILRELEALH